MEAELGVVGATQFIVAAFAPWFATMVILLAIEAWRERWLGPLCDCDMHVHLYQVRGEPWTPRRPRR